MFTPIYEATVHINTKRIYLKLSYVKLVILAHLGQIDCFTVQTRFFTMLMLPFFSLELEVADLFSSRYVR